MKNFTYHWRHQSSLFLLLMAIARTSMGAPNPEHGYEIKNLVAWPLTGKVVDQTGNALPGVTVLVKGTNIGTATGPDGVYSLSAPETAGSLVFSFVGFVNQEVPFTGPGTYNVTLSEDAKALEEVVVVGYGTQRKEDIHGR